NLAILPAEYAGAFHRFCQLNPKPCPIIGMSDVGSPHIPALGADLDIRTDVPRYRVWRDGEVVDEPTDVTKYWRDDLVTFVLGCSFSFEEALLDEGMPIRHIEHNVRVPMYRTNIACGESGPFAGPMVVSMRPFKPADAIRAVQITSRYPAVHGAPVHLGHPHLIGIKDIAKPDYGDPVPVADDEIPVFWGCGVTPQSVINAAKLPFAITHSPGLMLVTDLKNRTMAVI
ncbi:putative hydro-lyase, partial [Bradyrhizobium sp. 23]